LFSPSDLKTAVVKIIGDPDWIQQGSLFKDIKPGENKVAARTGFGEDGSISYENTDILFEMLWQRPEDYNIDTGLADPYSGGYSGNANGTREAVQSRVYRAKKVVSEFRGGKFEQTLEGTLYLFPKPKVGAKSAKESFRASEIADMNAAAAAAANQPVAAAARTGGDLSPAAAAAANSAETRNLLSRFPAASSLSAAALGAQGSYNNLGVGNGMAGQAAIEPGALAALSPTLLPAGSPRSATSGTGEIVGTVAETIGVGPPKLPQVLSGLSGLTVTQIAGQLAQNVVGAIRRAAVAGSTGGPSTQQIVKDQ